MSFLTDIHFALGQMRKRWVLTLAAAVSLALCIGLNTAIFSMFNATLLRPLPFSEPERIVEVFNSYPGMGIENGQSNRVLYTVYKEQIDAISAFALLRGAQVTFGESSSSERLPGLRVTPDFFATTRLVPTLGQPFRSEHGLPGDDRVVILTHGFWESAFGGNREIVGTEIQLDGWNHTVLGVLPASFSRWNPDIRVLLPYAWNPVEVNLNDRHTTYATLLGRLADGATVEQAQWQVNASDVAYREANPGMAGYLERTRHEPVVRLHPEERLRPIRNIIYLLQVFSIAILIVGALNVANLRLAEIAGRERELILRRVLGGSRVMLLRQLLVEAGILVLLAGILGVFVGWLSLGMIRESFALIVYDTESITLDGMVLMWAAVLIGVTILVVGLYPARILWRINFQAVLQEGGRGSIGDRGGRLQTGFGVVQAALTVFVLILSSLFIRSFIIATEAPLGFDADRVTTFRVALPQHTYPGAPARIAVVQRVLEGLRGLPGVEQAAGASIIPAVTPGRSNWTLQVRGEDLAGQREEKQTDTFVVTNGFFETMGIPIIAGRGIEETDTWDSREVFVVDRQFRDRYLSAGSVGSQFRFGGAPPDDDSWPIVVGEAAPIIHLNLNNPERPPLVYRSFNRNPSGEISFFMRSARSPADLLAEARRVVAGIDPLLPLFEAGSLNRLIDDSLRDWRAILRLAFLLAATALLLALAGIYVVLSNNLNSGRRPNAIRAALGATPTRLLLRLLLRGLIPVVIGLALGLVLAATVAPLFQEQLGPVNARDPMIFVSVVLFIAIVSLGIVLFPALAAARCDPGSVLHDE